MENMYKILATIGASVNFEVIAKDAQGNNISKRKIHIGGGSGVVDPRYRIMRDAVATWVSESELEELKKNPSFNRMVQRGHLIVVGDQKQAEKANLEEISKDMNPKDNSAQWSKNYMPTASSEVKNLDILDRAGDPIKDSKLPESRVIDAVPLESKKTPAKRGRKPKNR